MPSLTFYLPADMDNLVIGDDGILTAVTPTLIRVEDAVGDRSDYIGSFVYDSLGYLVGGTLTGFAGYSSGVLHTLFANASLPAVMFFTMLQSGDPQMLLSFALGGSDYIQGSDGPDLIRGYFGEDGIVGGAGDDTLYGGDGHDWLYGQTGLDVLQGENGNDFLDGGAGADTMTGGPDNDTYVIDDGGDVVSDVSGFDTVQSWISLTIGSGIEVVKLLGGAPLYALGDTLANFLNGNDGANTLSGLGGADSLAGGAGDDWIEGESGNNALPVGHTAGADVISGGGGNDTILAGGGDDLVHGDDGDDTIVGEAGGDVIYGDVGQDALDGGAGGDVIYGGVGVDIIFGDADGDSLFGGDQGDVMMGERGTDSVLGALDILRGEAGDDQLDGGAGDDWIYGEDGADVIDGDYGSDFIVGGPGPDIMLGSGASAYAPARTGNDLFSYGAMADAGDRIWGFDTRVGDTDGVDLRPLFDALGYAGTNPRADGFMTVTTGETPADSVIWIDANGGGDGYTPFITLYGVAPAGVTDGLFLFQ